MPAQLERAAQQGVGPVSGSRDRSHMETYQASLSHQSLTSLFALVLVPGPECTGLLRGTAGHICKSTVVIGNTLLVLEPTVEELKLKQCFLGKEGQRWVLGLCLSV